MDKDRLNIDTGSTIEYGGGELKASTDDPFGVLFPGTQLWDHRIDFSDDECIECLSCNMEVEIPEAFRLSSGFREVIYRLYALSKFKEESCKADMRVDQSVLEKENNITYDKSRTYYCDKNRSIDRGH